MDSFFEYLSPVILFGCLVAFVLLVSEIQFS